MWNLLSLGVNSKIYKPTAYTDASSITINEGDAYDNNFVTHSYAYQTSSSSDGVVLEQSTTYQTFATLGKATFSDVSLEIALEAYAYTGSATGGKQVTACVLLDYSTDGGSTYTNFYTLSSGWNSGGVDTFPGYPPTIATITGSTPVNLISGYITVIKNIPSSSFATGLQDLYIRVRLATDRITSGAGESSTSICRTTEISAVVS